jgi:hypothetical protein
MEGDRFQAAVVVDYGDLLELTEATSFVADEDGGSKLLIHHAPPDTPSTPAAP